MVVKSNNASKRIPLVDLFKGFAMICVVVVHAEQIIALPDCLDGLARFAQMGVQIFLLMSAFTLCISDSDRAGSFMGRIMKFIPAYWSMVIINCILSFSSLLILGKNYFWTSDNLLDYILNLLFLHGLFPNANNNVVPGGWFIGTLVIFYAIFPYLFRLYKKINVKYRLFIFPLACVVLQLIITSIVGYVNPDFAVRNNSFMYFNFVNQMPVFVLGFTLYDIYTNCCNIKHSLFIGIILLLCSFMLFNSQLPIYNIVQTIFALSVLFIFVGLRHITINENLMIVKLLMKFNKYSLAIYLTHSFVALYLMSVVSKILHLHELYEMSVYYQILVYILFTPIIVCIVYGVSVLYHKYVQFVTPFFSPLFRLLTHK